jgi:MATE family multidrug resistance protein
VSGVSLRGIFPRPFWRGEGGGREVLILAYPLILSQMSFTAQVFVDRLFLTWYSAEAVAAAVTALFVVWAVMGLCIGTGEYATTFIAQYLGAGRPDRIGAAVWQGIYFAAAAGLVIAALRPLAEPVFALAGHAEELRVHEVVYAKVLLAGGLPIVLMATLSSFFAGRGRTVVILVVNVLATVVNAILDYLWIFGHGGFPRMGVAGAAYATIVSQAFGAAVYLCVILRPEYRSRYGTLSGWRLEPALFGRLLRFGLPAGLQFSMEILAFAVFMVIVGRLGTAPLAASGIAFNLNMIVFMPMLGFGLAVSSLVGRYLGAERPDVAERVTWSALWMCLGYMLACCALYVSAPGILLAPYAAGADSRSFGEVAAIAGVLLKFVAFYSLFDMMNVLFAAALKGAGDTTYPVAATVVLAWGVMLVPTYVLCVLGPGGVYTAWTAAAAYIFCVGVLMFRRFRRGHWRSMRVIEPRVPELDPAVA